MQLLAVEEYAALVAEIQAPGASRDEKLAAAGVPLELYLASQNYWLGRIAAESKRSKSISFEYYWAAFRERQRQIQSRRKDEERAFAQQLHQQARSDGSFATGPAAPAPQLQAPLAHGLGVAAADGPRLTLAQWASFCSELAVHPEHDAAIHARYGFDPASVQRERSLWEARFAQDRALFDEYLAHFRHYRDWLLGARAAGT